MVAAININDSDQAIRSFAQRHLNTRQGDELIRRASRLKRYNQNAPGRRSSASGGHSHSPFGGRKVFSGSKRLAAAGRGATHEPRQKNQATPAAQALEQAAAATTALVPCWMASPLLVSQLSDPKSRFAVVIFDEASQVLPQDAITSIIRGKRVVIAGDKHQLPPTTFLPDRAKPMLTRTMTPPRTTTPETVSPSSISCRFTFAHDRWSGTIAASVNGLSPSRTKILRQCPHYVSEPRRAAARDPTCSCRRAQGDGHENSNSAEVLPVVDLVLDHAEHRPFESLGVIAMGIKHATRIGKTLYATRQKRPELDAFFSDQGERTFFCQ